MHTPAPETPAILVLEDGSVFEGVAIGVEGHAVGEVVFNTSMSGYQEILTDPSYAKQIVTFTYPHIGNTGVNREDEESGQVWAAGMVIRDLPLLASNWRCEMSLQDYLREQKVVGIAEIDTRRLTRKLRDGSLNGCVLAGGPLQENLEKGREFALQKAREFPGIVGLDLAKVVSTRESYRWTEGSWDIDKGYVTPAAPARYKVVAYDFGVKRNILRMLVDRGCDVTVVPAQTPAADVLAMQPDGVFLSNGPGDPQPCDYAIAAIREFLDHGLPLFGICLGHQLLALATGAKTAQMKLGHHGANHPVQELASGKVYITSQNHCFAGDASCLPANVKVTHRSLFDGSLQGLELNDKPAFGFQGHPEASPGPQDVSPVFDHFLELMDAHAAAR